MSDTDRHDCHCKHVVIIETKMSIAQWLIGFLAVTVAGLLINKVGENISIRIKDAPPAPFPGERLGSDRVPQPPPLPQGANGR